jgi:predicted nucleic-acid-binding protein
MRRPGRATAPPRLRLPSRRRARIALDTNVLVRALVMDHPDQVVIAPRLLRLDAVFISRTVLLETEWVLRAPLRQGSR